MDVFNRLKKFVVQLFQDDQFRYQLASASDEEKATLLEQLDYHFSQQEWESGMLQILDAKERDEFEELSEEQLAALAGAGLKPSDLAFPMYGIGVPHPIDDWNPPHPVDPLPPCRKWWSCLTPHQPYPPQTIYGAPIPKNDLTF